MAIPECAMDEGAHQETVIAADIRRGGGRATRPDHAARAGMPKT
jgi:hypothetical protein